MMQLFYFSCVDKKMFSFKRVKNRDVLIKKSGHLHMRNEKVLSNMLSTFDYTRATFFS